MQRKCGSYIETSKPTPRAARAGYEIVNDAASGAILFTISFRNTIVPEICGRGGAQPNSIGPSEGQAQQRKMDTGGDERKNRCRDNNTNRLGGAQLCERGEIGRHCATW